MKKSQGYLHSDARIVRKRVATERVALTVIIPTFEESKRICFALKSICTYLKESQIVKTWEILVIDDGSKDDTLLVVSKYVSANKLPFVSTVALSHKGKGAAIKEGFIRAQGDYVFFTDCDLATPVHYLKKLLAKAVSGCDVVIASRNMVGSKRVIEQSVTRHFLGQLFPKIVNALFFLKLTDTQCGFKLYRRESAKKITDLQTRNGWAFDVEHLVIAREFKFRVCEVAVTWTDKKGSRVSILSDGSKMLFELLAIWLNRLFVRYT